LSDQIKAKFGLKADMAKLVLLPETMKGYLHDWKNLWDNLRKILQTFAGTGIKKIKLEIPQFKDFSLQVSFQTRKFRRSLMFDKEYEFHEFLPFLESLNVNSTSTYRFSHV
jgi:hypothetical protein